MQGENARSEPVNAQRGERANEIIVTTVRDNYYHSASLFFEALGYRDSTCIHFGKSAILLGPEALRVLLELRLSDENW